MALQIYIIILYITEKVFFSVENMFFSIFRRVWHTVCIKYEREPEDKFTDQSYFL